MGRRSAELAFVLEAEALKRERRRGWGHAGVGDPESVADHSWRLALMAMLYADLLGLDGGKAARIALLHDLPEARTGDAVPGEWSGAQKHAREARALRAILRPLPPALRRRYFALWWDYEHGRSPEARLVAQLDKLEMVAQALAYERREAASGARLDTFWQTADRAVRRPELRERLRMLEARRPRPGAARGRARRGARRTR